MAQSTCVKAHQGKDVNVMDRRSFMAYLSSVGLGGPTPPGEFGVRTDQINRIGGNPDPVWRAHHR